MARQIGRRWQSSNVLDIFKNFVDSKLIDFCKCIHIFDFISMDQFMFFSGKKSKLIITLARGFNLFFIAALSRRYNLTLAEGSPLMSSET